MLTQALRPQYLRNLRYWAKPVVKAIFLNLDTQRPE